MTDVREKGRAEIIEIQRLHIGEPQGAGAVRATSGGEHWIECSNGRYTAYLLFQIHRSMDFRQVENISLTDRYPFSPRVFVPGMAQIHKGSTGKGVTFIALQTATVGGIVVAEVLRASAETNMNVARNPADRQFYINRESTMQNVRNVCIAAAVAVYLWNVIDGVVARGRPHVLVDGRAISFVPYVAPQHGNTLASGVSVSINF